MYSYSLTRKILFTVASTAKRNIIDKKCKKLTGSNL